MVAMRDEVEKLAADIYRPTQNGQLVEGKFPVILTRTPYNKEGGARGQHLRPLRLHRGHPGRAGAVQSEGHGARIDDPNDGFDTAQWIGSQPWSMSIGTIGTSYAGATQHALAIADAPYVKAMIPRNAMSDFGLYGVRHKGAFELRWFNWVFTLGNASETPTRSRRPNARGRSRERPALVAMGDTSRTTSALPLRPARRRSSSRPTTRPGSSKRWAMATTTITGRIPARASSTISPNIRISPYTTRPGGTTRGAPGGRHQFRRARKTKKSLQRLIVGPWIHSRENLTYAGDAEFTPDAALDLASFQRRWFDHWLKGIDNGVDREPPVRIYVMGGGDAHKTPEGRILSGGTGVTSRSGRCPHGVPPTICTRAGPVA